MNTFEARRIGEESPEKKKERNELPPDHKDYKIETHQESLHSIEDHKHAEELLESLQSKKFVKGNYEVPVQEPALIKKMEEKKKEAEQKLATTKKVVTNVSDFIPIIGSGKMVIEGLRGKQFGTGKDIHGYQRFLHTAFGVGFFALDCTGVGAIGSELGKGALKVGEQAALKTAEQIIAHQIIKKEAAKLAARGMVRIAKKEAIANSKSQKV